jgi:hypothetical protein
MHFLALTYQTQHAGGRRTSRRRLSGDEASARFGLDFRQRQGGMRRKSVSRGETGRASLTPVL